MDFNKLTIKSQEAIAGAQELARRRGNPEIYPEHLLLSLLDQELFADWQGLRADAEQKLAARPTASGSQAMPQTSKTTTSRPSISSSRCSRSRARRSSPGSSRFAVASASPRRTRRAATRRLRSSVAT
jgi:ATP-dependent Clp protease ATP-binding subunit ClpA